MEQIATSNFLYNCNQKAVSTNKAVASLSMSISLLAYNFMELDYEMDLKAERKEYKHPSFREALELFPEAASIAKRETKRQMNNLKRSIAGLSDIKDAEFERIYKEERPRFHASCTEGVKEGIELARAKYEKELRILSWRLSSFDKKTVSHGVTPDDILRAKAFPMTSLVEVGKDGKALCVWHSERTGSMHYYKKTNNVYCFGMCGRMYDVIDLYMKLHNVSFNQAVKALQ